jgi:NAD(P)-dependent dehydrogenase (short-subunit alcohol dehydrogenase family)
MKERRYGKIVNIISKAWLGTVGQTNYSASKGGLVSLTRTLALELAPYEINVNGVAPGLIDTPMTRNLPEKVKERVIKMQPTGKMGTTDDVAAAVCFLASDLAGFITGQILHVDGGKSCGLLSI